MAVFYLKGITMQSTNKSTQLLSIGNTIVDLEYSVDESLLSKLDIEKGSMTLIDQQRKAELVSELGADYKLLWRINGK